MVSVDCADSAADSASDCSSSTLCTCVALLSGGAVSWRASWVRRAFVGGGASVVDGGGRAYVAAGPEVVVVPCSVSLSQWWASAGALLDRTALRLCRLSLTLGLRRGRRGRDSLAASSAAQIPQKCPKTGLWHGLTERAGSAG